MSENLEEFEFSDNEDEEDMFSWEEEGSEVTDPTGTPLRYKEVESPKEGFDLKSNFSFSHTYKF
jgi:hypothetical protein